MTCKSCDYCDKECGEGHEKCWCQQAYLKNRIHSDELAEAALQLRSCDGIAIKNMLHTIVKNQSHINMFLIDKICELESIIEQK